MSGISTCACPTPLLLNVPPENAQIAYLHEIKCHFVNKLGILCYLLYV